MTYSTYHHTSTGPRPPYSRSSRTVGIICSAAAASTPGIRLKRFADAQPAAVVTERRAADVAVLGSSTAAVLAAYTLAKSGRKVGSPLSLQNHTTIESVFLSKPLLDSPCLFAQDVCQLLAFTERFVHS